jgi:hypothetical protein
MHAQVSQRHAHPLVSEASLFATRGKGGENSLSEESLAELRRSISSITDREELHWALDGLVDLASYLDEHGRSGAARALLKVAGESAPLLDRARAHPIVAEAALLLSAVPGASAHLNEQECVWLETGLAQMAENRKEFEHALKGLLNLSEHLDEIGETRGANDLLSVIATASPIAAFHAKAQRPHNGGLHPIVAEACLFLTSGDNHDVTLSLERARALEESLLGLMGTSELSEAASGLVDLAQYLDEDLGLADAANAVLRVVEAAEALIAIGPRDVHPVAAEAALYLTRTASDSFYFDAEARDAIAASLDDRRGRVDFPAAVRSLVDLAAYVDEAGGSEAAAGLLQLAIDAGMLIDFDVTTTSHPVMMEAALLVRESPGGQLEIGDDAATHLRNSLAALNDTEDLRAAIGSLVDLAHYLEKDKGALDAAEMLLELASDHICGKVTLPYSLHPVVYEAALLCCRKAGYPDLDDTCQKLINESLLGIPPGEQLRRALLSLVALAEYLEELGATHASEILLAAGASVADRMKFAPPIEKPTAAPIAGMAALLLKNDNGSFEFEDTDIEQLETALRSLSDTDQLRVEINALVDLARELEEEHGAREAGSRLLGIATRLLPELDPRSVSEMHDVLAEACLLASGKGDGQLQLDDAALTQLERSLNRLEGDELRKALASLVDLAAHLDDQEGGRTFANAILLVAARVANDRLSQA